MKFQVNYKYAQTASNKIRSASLLFEAKTAKEAREAALKKLAEEVDSGAFQVTGVLPFGEQVITK